MRDKEITGELPWAEGVYTGGRKQVKKQKKTCHRTQVAKSRWFQKTREGWKYWNSARRYFSSPQPPPPRDVYVLPDRTPRTPPFLISLEKAWFLGEVQSHPLLLTRKPSTSWASALRTSRLWWRSERPATEGQGLGGQGHRWLWFGAFPPSLPSFTLTCQMGRAVHPFQGGDETSVCQVLGLY